MFKIVNKYSYDEDRLDKKYFRSIKEAIKELADTIDAQNIEYDIENTIYRQLNKIKTEKAKLNFLLEWGDWKVQQIKE